MYAKSELELLAEDINDSIAANQKEVFFIGSQNNGFTINEFELLKQYFGKLNPNLICHFITR